MIASSRGQGAEAAWLAPPQPAIHDFDSQDGVDFLVMEFLGGETGHPSAVPLDDHECLAYDAGLRESGRCIASEALQPVETATTVRVRNGKLSVSDGAFAETKEQRAGFHLIEARDLNERSPGRIRMAHYVDGFVVPVPKKKLAAYRRMSQKAGKVWRDHGALEYIECAADDVKRGKWTSFPQSVKLKPGETVVFSYIVYKSRQHRDRINAKVMKDPRLAKMMDPKSMPFDGKRMFWGGFKTIVSA